MVNLVTKNARKLTQRCASWIALSVLTVMTVLTVLADLTVLTVFIVFTEDQKKYDLLILMQEMLAHVKLFAKRGRMLKSVETDIYKM